MTVESSGATTQYVPASGTVSLCGTINLNTSGDTRMRASQASTNYGSETTVTMSPFPTRRLVQVGCEPAFLQMPP